MRKLGRLSLILMVCALLSLMFCSMKTQAQEESVKNFFDSSVDGMRIQVNATAQTQPGSNLTVWLSVMPQASVSSVSIQLLQFQVYGFVNGTDEISYMGNITVLNIYLDGIQTKSEEYAANFTVPDMVWGTTFGNITLTNIVVNYSTPFGTSTQTFPSAVNGFYMTNVKNTYLESLENQIGVLKENIDQLTTWNYTLTSLLSQAQGNITELNQTVTLLNQNLTQLQGNYTNLHNSMNQLDNTREVAVILGITTVFFVVTTALMIMRRPRERW